MDIRNRSNHVVLSLMFIGLCWASSFAAKFDVAVDASKSWGALPHFWSCFGTCHYGIFLSHPEIKDHLRDAAKNLGMNKIRSHGFLMDDVGIYKEVNGQPVYNWTNADSIMDFLVSIGISPIMEFGSMPKDLASNPGANSFAYNQNISPPKDYTKYENLIKEFVKHYKEKYGTEVIDKWRLEVWNEPDMFFSGNENDYHKVYKAAALGAKAAYPKIKIGGASPSGPYRFGWCENLLNYCKTNSLPIDCFTFHTWIIGDCRTGHFGALDIIKKFDSNIESIDTEWGPTYEFHVGNQPQETTQGSICVADVVGTISRRCAQENKKFPWAYSWWVISDVFEEAGWNGYRNTPINTGNMGIISRQGLHKPAYNVFKMLNMMGDTQISISSTPNGSVNGMATLNTDSAIYVMLYNTYKDYGPSEGSERPPAGSDDVALTITGIPFSKVDYRCMVVDGEHSNAYAAWLDLGKPGLDAMNDDKWKTLRSASVLDTVDSANGLPITGKSFTRTFSLRKEGVMLVSLTPLPGTAVRDIAPTADLRGVDQGIAMAYGKGRISIRATHDRPYRFELFAPDGRSLCKRQGVRGNCSIPVTTIGPGVYIARIETTTGSAVVKQAFVPLK
jgi:xylan 1,4-beta-xylosidase